jgi:hypothetical protein
MNEPSEHPPAVSAIAPGDAGCGRCDGMSPTQKAVIAAILAEIEDVETSPCWHPEIINMGVEAAARAVKKMPWRKP